jgi:hypothetical protein
MWRWREYLPLDNDPTVGVHTGGTPLIRANRLAKALGLTNLWIKNDAVNIADVVDMFVRGFLLLGQALLLPIARET